MHCYELKHTLKQKQQKLAVCTCAEIALQNTRAYEYRILCYSHTYAHVLSTHTYARITRLSCASHTCSTVAVNP
jgi:hypothetical protein